MTKETMEQREERLLSLALSKTEPFTISELVVGRPTDYQVASRLCRRLVDKGDLRNVAGAVYNGKWLPERPFMYVWVNE